MRDLVGSPAADVTDRILKVETGILVNPCVTTEKKGVKICKHLLLKDGDHEAQVM